MRINKPFLAIAISLAFVFSSNAQTKKPAKPPQKKPVVIQKARPIGAVVISAATAPPEELLSGNLTPSQKKRVETFLEVWRTLRDSYFDKTFSGLNWDDIKKEYGPRVKLLKTDTQLHTLLQEMINRLDRSHLYIIPPEAYQEIENAKAESQKKEAERKAARQGEQKDDDKDEPDDEDEDLGESEQIFIKFGLPIDLRIIEEQAVLTYVEPGSDAEKAGLRSGYVIEAINGITVKDLVKRFQTYNSYSKKFVDYLPLVLVSMLEGQEDSEVELTFANGENKSNTALVKRQGLKGELVTILKNLPEDILNFDTRSIDEKTGYIKFNHFAYPVLNKFCEAITSFKSKEAVIIDLRGNTGGSLAVLYGITGLLVKTSISMGDQITRAGERKLIINPMTKHYPGRIIVLIDSQSASASEMLAAGLQENGRAIVVGEKSAGSALPSVTKTLPTKAVFIYPYANYRSPKGNFIEGKGVVPDLQIALDRKSLLDGKDAQLEKAVAYANDPAAKLGSKTAGFAMTDMDSPPPPKPTPKPTPKPAPPPARTDGPIVSDDEPPPPPKPKPTPPPVPRVVAANPPSPVAKVQDEKALEVVRAHIEASGGEAALLKLKSIAARGELKFVDGDAELGGVIELYRKTPNKYAEIYLLEGAGEIREVFDGKTHIVQSLYTGVQELKVKFLLDEIALFADFQEMLRFKELYPSAKYTGVFEREGRKVHLIEAVSAEGVRVAFSFDAETKLLTSRAGSLINVSYGEYKKFGEILFPTVQTRARQFSFTLSDIRLNPGIDDSMFVKEDNCFTKTN